MREGHMVINVTMLDYMGQGGLYFSWFYKSFNVLIKAYCLFLSQRRVDYYCPNLIVTLFTELPINTHGTQCLSDPLFYISETKAQRARRAWSAVSSWPGHNSNTGLLATKQDFSLPFLAPYQYLEPVLQTVLPRTRNCQWFRKELADFGEAIAKLAQASLVAMLPSSPPHPPTPPPAKPVLGTPHWGRCPGITPSLGSVSKWGELK